MEPLEDVLRKVEELKRDLVAEVKIGEHWEQHEGVWVGGSRDGTNPGYYETEPWDEKVDECVPDTQKRDAARQVLQQIYDSSEWYSIRYIISKSVGNYEHGMFISAFPLTRNFDMWAQDLRQRMNDPRKDRAYKLDVLKDASLLLIEAGNNLSWAKRVKDEQGLKEFLEECYANNPNNGIRMQAGKYLKYHKVRIWAHEHPIGATLAGIATVGAASGLGYLIYEYLNK